MAFKVAIGKQEDVAALTREQVRDALDERREALHLIFQEAGPEYDPAKVKFIEVKDGADLVNQINQRDEELNWLGEREQYFTNLDMRRVVNERRGNQPAGADPRQFFPRGEQAREVPRPKSLGEMFMDSPVYEAAKAKRANISDLLPGRPEAMLDIRPLNAQFTTAAGWAPESLRTGRVVESAQRQIEVTDILPSFPTSMAAIVYMEETTFTNAAAERAEAAAYAEAALALTQRSVTVRSIGTSIPVTDEQLADVDGVASYLDQRLGFMVRQRLDSQILVGDGIAPNLTGTLNTAGINTQAKGADPTPDAIYKAIVTVRATGRAEPNVVIMHPLDWQDVRLLRTTEGMYIWGSPSAPGPEMIWGLPVVLTTAVTPNTAIVGDYARFAGLHIRAGLEVLTGFVNDDFTKGLVHIRAGIRAAVVHYRPAAFTQVTGI